MPKSGVKGGLAKGHVSYPKISKFQNLYPQKKLSLFSIPNKIPQSVTLHQQILLLIFWKATLKNPCIFHGPKTKPFLAKILNLKKILWTLWSLKYISGALGTILTCGVANCTLNTECVNVKAWMKECAETPATIKEKILNNVSEEQNVFGLKYLSIPESLFYIKS